MMPQTEHLSPNAYSREGSGKQIVHIKCLHSTGFILLIIYFGCYWVLVPVVGFSGRTTAP